MGAHGNLQLMTLSFFCVGYWVYFISVHTSALFVEILKKAKYVCMYMCVVTCAHAVVCNCMWRPSVSAQCLPQSLSNCFVRHGLSLSHKLLNSSRLAKQRLLDPSVSVFLVLVLHYEAPFSFSHECW